MNGGTNIFKDELQERFVSVTTVDGSVGSQVQVSEGEGHVHGAFTDGPARHGEAVQV